MSDFTLVVGVSHSESYGPMLAEVNSIVNDINSHANKINIKFNTEGLRSEIGALKTELADLTGSMNSGAGGLGGFQQGVINGMRGIGEVLRYNMEQIHDMSKALDALSKKDFTTTFDLSSLLGGANKEKIAEYKITVKDYADTVRKAIDEFANIQNNAALKSQASKEGFNFGQYAKAIREYYEEIGKINSSLNISNSFAALDNNADKIRAYAETFRSAFEELNRIGLTNFDLDKIFAPLTRPESPASQVDKTITSIKDALAQLMPEMKVVAETGGEYQQHAASVQSAATAEQQKAAASKEVASSVTSESQALTESAAAAEKDSVAKEKAATATGKAESAFKRLQEAISNGKIDTDLQGITNKMSSLDAANFSEKLVSNLARLKELYAIINDPGQSNKNRLTAWDEYSEKIKVVREQLKLVAEDERKATAAAESAAKKAAQEAEAEAKAKAQAEASEEARIAKRNSLITQYNTILQRLQSEQAKWTKASTDPSTSEAYRTILSLITDITTKLQLLDNEDITPDGLKELERDLGRIRAEAKGAETSIKGAGNAVSSYFDKGIKDITNRLTYTFSMVQIFFKAIQEVKKMISEAVEIDTALTQLQIVTRASSSDMSAYSKQVSQMAKETAQSTKDLIDATTVYARLGYTMDESSVLAKYTAMLQGVGDISASDAQDAMTAIIKAFGKNVSDVESVMDKLVVVGNNFPISVSQIAEGMNNAGSMLAVAGNSLEESIALLTAANTTTQDISKASTGLRTIAARIRKTTTELDDLGEAINESKYEEMIQALAGKNISFTDAEGNYRSTYAILKDIAAVWNELGSMDQAAIIESLAGTRQQNVFASLITQFQEAERAMGAMKNSAGELQKSYDIYLGSIQAHVNQLKVAFTSLSTQVVNSDLAKFVVDAGRVVIEVITSIINSIGLLGTAIAALATGALIKGAMASGGLLAFFSSIVEAMPFIWPFVAGVLALGGAIALVVTGVKKWKEAHPTLKQLKEDTEAAKAAVEETQSALEENNKRIQELKELNQDGGLSATEKAELDLLYQQNEVLERQLKIRQAIYNQKKELETKKATSDIDAWLETPRTTVNAVGLYGEEYTSKNYGGYGGLLNRIDELKEAREKYAEAQLKFDETGKKRYKEDAEYWSGVVDSTLNALEEIQNEIVGYLEYDPNNEGLLKALGLISDTLGASGGDFDRFKDGLSQLPKDIFKSLGDDAEVTAGQIDELAQSSEELSAWMTKLGFDSEDVAIFLNRMKSEVAGAADGTEALTDDVTNLEGELAKATEALEQYNKAASGEHGEIGTKYKDAYQKFLDDWQNGKTGSKAVQAAIELILPDDVLQNLDYDLVKAGELLSSDLYQAIFSGEGDMGLNFARYIQEHADIFDGIASVTKNAQTGMYEFTYDSLPALAQAFGLSEDAVAVFLDSLEAYGVQAMMSKQGTIDLATELGLIGPNADASASNVERVASAIAQLAQEGKSSFEIKKMLDALNSAGIIDLSEIENLGETIAAAVQAAKDNGDEAKLTVTCDDQATDVINTAVGVLKDADGKSATMYIQTVDLGTAGGSSNDSSGASSSPKPRGGPYSKAYGGVVKNGGETLVNELGPELIAENGRAYIAGGGQPTMVNLSPGAIVLDADTTKKAINGHGGTGVESGKSVRSAAYIGVKKFGNDPILGFTDTGTSGKNVDLLQIVKDTGKAVNNVVAATINSLTGKNNNNGGGGSGGSSSSSSSSGENWFEKQLAEHKHLVAMDKESQKEYLDWLNDAYKKAYNEGLIDLKAYRQHEEEVYKGRQNDFKDHLNDAEHMIDMEKNGENSPTVIYNMYQQMMNDVQAELNKAYAAGLDQNNEYVQYLQNQWYKYFDALKDAEEKYKDEAESKVKDLVEYRIKMLKQYIKNEIDSLKDRLSYLKDFYSKQKEMLQDVYDTDNYLEEQAEKRKSVSDIQNELQQLEFDDSAWAQKRRLQLQEELENAQKELGDFEKQHALKEAQDQLDAAYDIQEAAINARIDQLEERLNDPKYLYDQALHDVQNNSVALYEEMIEYNNKYGLTIQAHTQGDLCE